MRILIVTNDISTDSLDLLKFKDFADIDEIETRFGFESGKDFIQNALIKDKEHIDFIVVTRQIKKKFSEFDIDVSDMEEFAIWIRGLKETYSSDNFQIQSIPLILDDEMTIHRDFMSNFNNRYYDLVTCIEHIREDRIISVIGKPINNWLNKLGDELDDADLDTEFRFEKSLVPKKDTFDVKILSQGFFKRLRKLDYVWIGNNINKLYVDSDLFKRMLLQSSKNNDLRNEKEYHKFLQNNSGLLIGDQYSKPIYENQFYYTMSRSYVEPDFVNLSYTYSFRPHQIFEVKLPNQRLISDRTKAVSNYLKKSLNQIGIKYFNYFDKSENPSQIKKGLGLDYLPTNFNYKLLIGRSDDKDENLSIINNYLESQNLSVDIITYDELLNKYQKIYNRVQRFNLK